MTARFVTPPLLAVTLVFRSRPEFDSLNLNHLVSAVSAYVDSSVEQPLHKACKFGSVTLLDRIWNTTVDLEPSGWGIWSVRKLLRTQKLYGKLQFSLCLLEAAKLNSVDIARWLFERFPYGVRHKVICEAVKAGALEILQFFRTNGTPIHAQEVKENGYEELDEERENWEGERYIHFDGIDATEAVLAGREDLVKWLYEQPSEMRSHHSSINAAFSIGNIELAVWIMGLVGVDPERHEALHGAATNGHVKTLQWFQDNGKYMLWDTGTLLKAAEAGHLEIVQWIIDRDRQDNTLGYESGSDEFDTGLVGDDSPRRTYITCLGGEASLAIHAAAINGHLEVAKYLHASIEKPRNQKEKEIEERRLSKTKDALWRCFKSKTCVKAAMLSTTPDIVQKVSGETMMMAAERGFLGVVKWLYTEYQEDPTVTLFWIHGHLDEYGRLYFNYVEPVFCSVVDAAAGKGHLAIVQYLLLVGDEAEQVRKRQRTETYPDQIDRYKIPGCTTIAMDTAAANGHLEVVQWLHANCSEGCTTAAMDFAAESGYLETVKWLHGNRGEGCTTKAMDRAAVNGRLEVVKWLHANRSEGCTTNAMNGAAENGHLHVIKWLHEHRSEGCTSDAMDNAAGKGHFEIVKWLLENRTEGGTVAAMNDAALDGHLNIVQWLHIHGGKCTRLAIDGAARGGHLYVLRWLYENRDEEFSSDAIRNAALHAQFETLLILHQIAQQGLAKDIEVTDAKHSDTLLSKYYLEIVWNLLT
ncbi:hypothetical protein DVH05_017053 [Phytophthora capsici]|nr:hypothetical protein DVH05_017053 [Phytophthora capsici]